MIHVVLRWFIILFAVETVYAFPTELMYQGKPIDSLCLFQMEGSKGGVDLKHCGLHTQKGEVITGKNKTLIKQGFLGYNFGFKTKESVSPGGYSYYKVVGQVGQAVVVETVNNGGGTGSFSLLSLVRREGDKLNIEVLTGGDRCNGGLELVSERGTQHPQYLEYGIRLTPYALLTLSRDNPHHLKAYDDLADCAICCIATARVERPLDPNFSKVEHLLYIQTQQDLLNESPATPAPKYQACFNQLLKQHSQKNHGKFDEKQLALFTHEFNAQCVQG